MKSKEIIYTILFYAAGLIIGSVLFQDGGDLKNFCGAVFLFRSKELLTAILSRLVLYFFVLVIILAFSFCMFGFSLINFLPLVFGISTGLRLSFYYSYSFKGIGYALITAVFQTSLFVTMFVFSIKNSILQSKYIYDSTIKKSDMTNDDNVKSYLKKFLIYSVLYILIALINSVTSYVLGGLIKL